MTLMPVTEQVLTARLLVVGGRRAVDRAASRWRSTGPASSCGLPSTSMMRPSVAVPTGTLMPLAGVLHGEAAAQAVGGTHGDGAHDAVAELLLHFERQIRRHRA